MQLQCSLFGGYIGEEKPPTKKKKVRCLLCHRPLTDPVSVARKLGPTCMKKLLADARKKEEN